MAEDEGENDVLEDDNSCSANSAEVHVQKRARTDTHLPPNQRPRDDSEDEQPTKSTHEEPQRFPKIGSHANSPGMTWLPIQTCAKDEVRLTTAYESNSVSLGL